MVQMGASRRSLARRRIGARFALVACEQSTLFVVQASREYGRNRVQCSQRRRGILGILKDQRRCGILAYDPHDRGQLGAVLPAEIIELIGNRNQAGQTYEGARRKRGGENQLTPERHRDFLHSVLPSFRSCELNRRPAACATSGRISKWTRLSSR